MDFTNLTNYFVVVVVVACLVVGYIIKHSTFLKFINNNDIPVISIHGLRHTHASLLLYEGVSIGFLLSSFINYSPIKGMLFGTIFIIISKIIYITILIYLLTNTLKYTKNFLKRLKMAKNELIINQVIKISFCTTITLINDIILYFIGNKIITIFKFIL